MSLQEQIQTAIAGKCHNEMAAEQAVLSATVIAEQYAAKFAEWLYLNGWHYYDGKSWHYTFEGGIAISKAAYAKNYIKTTAELLTIFNQQQYAQ